MTVNGEEAAAYNAVRLDSFANVNDGLLVEANTQTGFVRWKDKTNEEKTATLGERAIFLVRRGR